ncbi:transglycosylase SLT domain-containing protein [Defluviimonas sp. CAU 1641]|uniref:Transglycosylase SLT domain-containing protein n=2 Tax=Defluviimonas salinarum TaxID=2992147 RepID=A0ABT3J2Z3_9RHOB|nr:transglycosylase SLT domain-containing protein [Defluviimonas salinarum]MCW3782038.1 transglycosylase SLT domain-containing protein [Defluviimonas salinarum]
MVAAEASQRTGVPVSVLRAISLTETGRRRGRAIRPWPWTVNMEGKGLWFESEREARTYVYKEYDRGARSFDVGCFQLNFKWHGAAFRSIDDMFDPLTNALYAARFLKSLHAEQGSWSRAAGAYHSRTPEYAGRYQARFDRFRNSLLAQDTNEIPAIPDIVGVANDDFPSSEGTDPDAMVGAIARVNRYPLLQTGGTSGLGSLVPLGNGGGASLFGAPPPLTEDDQ